MKCIFCKESSNNSKSAEHILPESLGNKEHFLGKGIVCDKCNNYFATKIEKPVLEKPYFKNVRHRNFIRTKKGHLVPQQVWFPFRNGGPAEMWLDEDGYIFNPKDEHIIDGIQNRRFNKMIVPIIGDPKPDDHEISR